MADQMFKRIKDEILASAGWIHTMDNHQGIMESDASLRYRAKTERKDATCFIVDVDETIEKVLDANEKEICTWMNDMSTDDFLEITLLFFEKIGKGYSCYRWHDWKKGPAAAYMCRVILGRRVGKYGITPYLKSAYPVLEEDEYFNE